MSDRFINSIEGLAESIHLKNGDITKAIEDILKECATVLNCERVNSWIFNSEGDELTCLKAFTLTKNKYSIEQSLLAKDLPNYFKELKKGKIIVANKATEEPMNLELLSIYIQPLEITSMIDMPIRSEGKMIGVVCFEHVQQKHTWTIEEERYCQSAAQLLSLILESNKKNAYQKKLEATIREKEILLSEVNHRVKNNMAVILGLLKMQKSKSLNSSTPVADLFDEIINRVYSMSNIQSRLISSNNFSEISLDEYIKDLIENMDQTYGSNKKIGIYLDLDPINLDTNKAIPCGLIINEILTNSFKYAFETDNKDPKLSVSIKKTDFIEINIKDNGPGFDLTTNAKKSMGLELIEGLSTQIDADLKINSENGVNISIII
jgi:two-component sensor histidine kinase